MNYFLPLVALVIFSSCASNSSKEHEELSAIKSNMDSLLVEMKLLKEQLNTSKESDTDTSVAKITTKIDTVKPTVVTKTPTQKPIEKKVVEAPKNDTIYHHYINGKISVKIHPWVNEEREIELFDLYGKLTFRTKDINKSYSVFNRLSFHSNGAVSKIEESNNPGASLYMYKSIMTFSTTNNPEVRTNHKWPSTLQDELESQTPWFWNKNTMQWVKQEVIECDNPDPNRKQSP
jgi:hypothetical protein